jgi:(2Fe-2S) ferredoxin
MKSFYRYHVFFCTNQRPPGERTCCADKGANEAREHAKQRIKALKLAAPGKVRINQAGCMERCERGPCLVVYPEAVWYRYESTADIDAIIDEHILGGQPVQRLRI